MSTKKTLPPIKQLITDSWSRAKISAWHLVRLGLITLGLELVLLLVIGAIGVGLGFSTNMFEMFAKGATPDVSEMIRAGALGGFFFALWMVLAIFIATVAQITGYKIVADPDTQISILDEMKRNKSAVLPLWGAGILMGLLIFGNLFLFVIPGIIVAILFTFTVMEIVLGGRGIVAAMKRSVTLVTHNFKDLVLRWLVIIGMSMVISFIFSSVGDRRGASEIASLLSMIVNIVFTIFSFCYTVLLYKQIDAITPKDKQASLNWIVGLALLGWLVAGVVGGKLIDYATSPEGQRLINSAGKYDSNERNTDMYERMYR